MRDKKKGKVAIKARKKHIFDQDRLEEKKKSKKINRKNLSKRDKKKLYPVLLDYLKGKNASNYVQDLVLNDFAITIIFSDARVKRTDRKEEGAYTILKILFFALYKAKDKQDLIAKLRVSFLDMDRNEIDELIEKTKVELKRFTGEDLLKNLEAILIGLRNDELINKNDDIISEEKQIFVNNKMKNKKLQAEHDTEDLITETAKFSYAIKKTLNDEFNENLKKFLYLLVQRNIDTNKFPINIDNFVDKVLSLYNYAKDKLGFAKNDLKPNGRHEYLAGTILYYGLLLEGIVSKGLKASSLLECIDKELNITPQNINISYFYNFLSKDNRDVLKNRGVKIRVTYKLKYSNDEFREEFNRYLDLFLKILKESKILGKIGIDISKKIILPSEKALYLKDLVIDFFDKNINNRDANLYKSLGKGFNSPHLLAGTCIYLCLQIYFCMDDVVLNKQEFFNLLPFSKEFYSYLRHYTINYLNIDKKLYKYHVFTFLCEFLKLMDKEYDLGFSDLIYKKLFQRSSSIYKFLIFTKLFISNDGKFRQHELDILKILNNNGFDLKVLTKKNLFKNFFPQYIAACLIIFLKDTPEIKHKKLLRKDEICELFGVSNARVGTLFRLFEGTVQKMNNHRLTYSNIYLRETFIKDLQNLIDDYFHLETKFVLDLYKLTNLKPDEFVKRLKIYKQLITTKDGRLTKRGAASFVLNLKQKCSFTNPTIYSNIKSFIDNNLSGMAYIKALALYESLIKIHSVTLKDRKSFCFRYNPSHLELIDNSYIKSELVNHIDIIKRGELPKYNKRNIKCSRLEIKGILNEKIKDSYIEKKLVIPMIEQNRITKYSFKNSFDQMGSSEKIIYKLCSFAHDIYNNFKEEKKGIYPKHYPILNKLLMSYKYVIFSEVPIWKRIKNTSHFFIGNVDLFVVDKNILKVVDFKRNKNQVFRSLPQVSAYGYILKEFYQQNYFLKKFDIKCVSFTPKFAWEFDPDILENEILNFISSLNKMRENRLESMPMYRGAERTDLYNDIRNLLS